MRYKYLKQILICFFCILFISSIILCLSFVYSGNIINQKQKDDAQRKLSAFTQDIDDKLKQFVIISRMFLTDDKSISFMKNGNILTDELRALRPAMSQNIGRLYSVYEDVALSAFFIVDDQFVYTNGSMYYFDLFFNSLYSCQDYSADWWKTLLSSNQSGFLIERSSILIDRLGLSTRTVPVIYTLRGYSNPGIVGMYLSIDKLIQNGLKEFGYHSAQLIILDVAGNFAAGTLDAQDQELILLEKGKSGVTIQLSGQSYMLVKNLSSIANWNCCLLIPIEELNIEVSSLLKGILVICCLMLAGCIAISVFFSIKLHKPVRLLLNQISYSKSSGNVNEFSAISNSIHQLRTEVDSYSAQSDQEILLNYLIGKRTYDEEAKQILVRFLGQRFQEGYNVSAIRMFYEKKFETLDENERAETYEKDFNCFNRAMSQYSGIVLRLHHDLYASVLNASDMNSFLSNVESKIQENAFVGAVRYGVSEAIHTHAELPKALLSAICCIRKLEVAQILGVCKMNTTQLTDIPEVVGTSESALMLAISAGKTDAIMLEIQNIITQQIQNGLSDIGLRALIIQILSQIVHSLKDHPYIAHEMLKQSEFETLMHSDIPLQNTDALISLLHSLLEWLQLQRNNAVPSDNKKTQLVQFTKDYIDNHYKMDLSLEQVADAMHVSPKTLSQVFREQTEDSVIHYIQKVRISSACHLLAETVLPIEDIYTHVGFVSKTTFFRNFKQVKGITPSEYRTIYSSRKDDTPYDS